MVQDREPVLRDILHDVPPGDGAQYSEHKRKILEYWVFKGSVGQQYKQVGNAVPVLLAYEVAKKIHEGMMRTQTPLPSGRDGQKGVLRWSALPFIAAGSASRCLRAAC